MTERFPEEPNAEEEPTNTIDPPTNGSTTNGNHQENGENGTPGMTSYFNFNIKLDNLFSQLLYVDIAYDGLIRGF